MISGAEFVARFPKFQNLMKRGEKLGAIIGIASSPIPFLQPVADRLAESFLQQLNSELGSTIRVLLK